MTFKTLIAATAFAVTASAALADGHATTHTVTIEGFAFAPATLTISEGDTVTFVNQDGAPHTATANNGAFDTGRLSRGQEASLTFTAAGTFDYFCEVHPNMTATIVVE
jgi:plastocyanin